MIANTEELPISFLPGCYQRKSDQKEVWLNHGSRLRGIRRQLRTPTTFTPVGRRQNPGRRRLDQSIPIAPTLKDKRI